MNKKQNRFHTTLSDETINKMEFLKEYHNLRFSNDLIKLLVDKEYKRTIKKGGNKNY